MSNFYASYPVEGGGGGGVTTLNGLSGALTLVAGSGITITPSGSNITIASSGSSGANTSLSNLSAVAINTSLLPGSDATIALGSATDRYTILYAQSAQSNAVSNIDLNARQLHASDGTNSIDYDGRALQANNLAQLTWSTLGVFIDKALALNGSTSGAVTLEAASTTTPYTLVMPPAQGAAGTSLQNDGTGVLSWASGGGSGANQTLSNLTSPTAVNQDLLFNTGALTNVKTQDGATTQSIKISSGVASAGDSGSVFINTASATGTSGSLFLQIDGGLGNGGRILLQDGSQGNIGDIWTSTDTSGRGQWQTLAPSLPLSGGSMTGSILMAENTQVNWNEVIQAGDFNGLLFNTSTGPNPVWGFGAYTDGAGAYTLRVSIPTDGTASQQRFEVVSGSAGGNPSLFAIWGDGTTHFTGDLDAGTHQIHNVVDPTSAQDVATKNYVDTQSTFLPLAGGSMTGTIKMAENTQMNWNEVIQAGDFNGLLFNMSTGPNPVWGFGAYTDGAGTYTMRNSFATDVADSTRRWEVVSGSAGGNPSVFALWGDGSAHFTGTIDAGTHLVSNVLDPASPQDAATKNYVDNLIPLQAAGVTPATTTPGALALTSAFILAVYNGTSWVQTSDGTTPVTF